MTTEVRRLYDNALGLNDVERAELAGLLIDSLDEGRDETAQEAWSDEIARRLSEIDSGAVKTIPWADVRRRMMRGAE